MQSEGIEGEENKAEPELDISLDDTEEKIEGKEPVEEGAKDGGLGHLLEKVVQEGGERGPVEDLGEDVDGNVKQPEE